MTVREFTDVLFLSAFCFLAACTAKIPDSEPRSEITTKDGVVLVGKFSPPKNPGKFTFILLHGLASSKNEWYGFADKLSAHGYGYLAVDLRGHNESNKTKSDEDVSYKNFGWPGPGSQWSKMPEDVDAMVKYLTRQRRIKKDTVALAGASVGANLVLIYSAKNKFVPLTILLSPGLNYAEFLTAQAMKEYGKRPVFIAASPKDEYAYASSERLITLAKETGANVTFLEGTGNRHGVQMFDGKFEEKLLGWIDSLGRK